jgi:hypothetical protein
MTEKLLSPIALFLGVLISGWLFGQIQGPDRAIRLRFWIFVSSGVACMSLAVAWHNEIGSAWQNNPHVTALATFAFFGAALFAVRPLLRK